MTTTTNEFARLKPMPLRVQVLNRLFLQRALRRNRRAAIDPASGRAGDVHDGTLTAASDPVQSCDLTTLTL